MSAALNPEPARGGRPTVTAIIDQQAMSLFQLRVYLICGLALFCDAFNLQILAYAGPGVAADLELSPAKLGLLVSITLAGGALGAASVGSIADRLGRRVPFIILCFWFGAFTLLGATAGSFDTFLLFRFAEGFGLGATLPNANALAAEFSGARRRRLVLALVAVGYTAGSSIAGFVARPIISAHGWRALFALAGFGGIVLGVVSLLWLPESLFFLARNPAKAPQFRRALKAVARMPIGEDSDLPIAPPVETTPSASLPALWRPEFRRTTAALWGVTFLVMLTVFLFATWTPSLATTAGLSSGNAISLVAVFFGCGTVGGLAIGWLMDRYSPALVLAICWLAASAGFVGLALAGSNMAAAAICAGIAGFALTGGLGGLILLSTTYYPETVRVTGTGWMLAFGRIGSIVGPWLGSAIVAASLAFPAFLAIVVATTLTATALSFYLAFGPGRGTPAARGSSTALGKGKR